MSNAKQKIYPDNQFGVGFQPPAWILKAKQKAISLCKANEDLTDIAYKTGVNIRTVRRWVQEAGIYPKRQPTRIIPPPPKPKVNSEWDKIRSKFLTK